MTWQNCVFHFTLRWRNFTSLEWNLYQKEGKKEHNTTSNLVDIIIWFLLNSSWKSVQKLSKNEQIQKSLRKLWYLESNKILGEKGGRGTKISFWQFIGYITYFNRYLWYFLLFCYFLVLQLKILRLRWLMKLGQGHIRSQFGAVWSKVSDFKPLYYFLHQCILKEIPRRTNWIKSFYKRKRKGGYILAIWVDLKNTTYYNLVGRQSSLNDSCLLTVWISSAEAFMANTRMFT